jgi:putative phosphotransacetylase
MTNKIKIEVSGRHAHLKREDIDKLFGKGYQLKKFKDLSQPGEFAAKEKVILKNGKKELKVRIIGPERKYTQVELSKTDAYQLGVSAPVRMSGEHRGSKGVILIGAKGKSRIKKGVIIANRHIHANPQNAKKYNLKNGQIVKVEVKGERALIFDKVKIKIHENFNFNMHIDTDEANAAGIDKKGCFGFVKNK